VDWLGQETRPGSHYAVLRFDVAALRDLVIGSGGRLLITLS